MAVDYKPITGQLVAVTETFSSPKGNAGDYFVLLRDDGDKSSGIYRINEDGSYSCYGALGGELRVSTSLVNTAIDAVKILISQSSVSPTALSDAVKTLQDLVASSKATQDVAIASAIAEWSVGRPYKKDQITIRNKTFFLCLVDNVGKDPLLDTSGAWGVFTPGSASDVFANRQPANTDVYPAGVKWWDTSFGADTPLGLVSLGNGAWQFLNQITLSRIRFNIKGMKATYRSGLHSVKLFRSDGTLIPNSWLVCGQGTLPPAQPGVAYAGQNASAGYNADGWFELEPSTVFDAKVSIGRVAGTPSFLSIGNIEFYYSNGSKKIYSGPGTLDPGGSEVNLCLCDPAIPCRYGDSIAAVQGPNLVASQLANTDHLDYGRVNGREFVSAVMQLLAPIEARLKTLEPVVPVRPTIFFEQSGAEFVASLTPPVGKSIQFASVDWLLNQSAPTLRQVSQGGGQSDVVRHLYPTDPGDYNLQITGRFTDGDSFQLRHDFTV